MQLVEFTASIKGLAFQQTGLTAHGRGYIWRVGPQ
jgi:hypothetical protein